MALNPEPKNHTWYLYIIITNKNTLYTGITKDPEKRFLEHKDSHKGIRNAKGAKFFRSVAPLKIVYLETHTSRSDASKREAIIKKMSTAEKRALYSN